MSEETKPCAYERVISAMTKPIAIMEVPSMTNEEIAKHKKTIDSMTREDMARLWRFAPAGHPYFISGSELWEHFDKRYKQLGQMSSEISKKIGW